MKLRMKSNSIRIRVSQTELNDFYKHGVVSEHIEMGPIQSLSYGIERSGAEQVTAIWENDTLRVMIPEELAEMWCTTEIVGFDETVDIGEGKELYVLVEKDFQCLKPRAEDESDLFPHPEA